MHNFLIVVTICSWLSGCSTLAEFIPKIQKGVETYKGSKELYCSPGNVMVRTAAIHKLKQENPDYVPICPNDRTDSDADKGSTEDSKEG